MMGNISLECKEINFAERKYALLTKKGEIDKRTWRGLIDILCVACEGIEDVHWLYSEVNSIRAMQSLYGAIWDEWMLYTGTKWLLLFIGKI